MIKAETGVVIGSGGREHALLTAYAEAGAESLVFLPGNDFAKYDIQNRYGIQVTTNRDLPPEMATSLKKPETFKRVLTGGHYGIVDVAQDDVLAAGLADWSRSQGYPTVGHGASAAEIEWRKSFGRELNDRAGIPQPEYSVFTSAEEALAFLDENPDIARFIKADGLAEGKAAIGAKDNYEARQVVKEIIARFPQAAQKIILEEWMLNEDGTPGDEFSHFLAAVGPNALDLGFAVDFKRAYDNDEGENTGSMGSNSPTNLMTDELKRQTRMHIVEPLLSQMEAEGLSPQGIIYVSGMVTRDNEGHKRVRVTEYNARLGDPEGQLIIPSVRNYSEIAKGIAEGDISGMTVDSDDKSRLVVTGASRGYPSNYDRVKGKRLTGVEEAQKEEGVHLNGAGITYDSEGNPTATGGRVIYSVGEGEHEDPAVAIEIARERAYAGMSHLRIEGENGENDLHYRRDIGMPDIRRAQASRTA